MHACMFMYIYRYTNGIYMLRLTGFTSGVLAMAPAGQARPSYSSSSSARAPWPAARRWTSAAAPASSVSWTGPKWEDEVAVSSNRPQGASNKGHVYKFGLYIWWYLEVISICCRGSWITERSLTFLLKQPFFISLFAEEPGPKLQRRAVH